MYSTERFNGVAKEYSLGRPDYAIDLINLLFQQYGFSDSSIVADIGSGTGKFAKQLLDRGCSVIGVEPNDDMRCFAEKELYDYEYTSYSPYEILSNKLSLSSSNNSTE